MSDNDLNNNDNNEWKDQKDRDSQDEGQQKDDSYSDDHQIREKTGEYRYRKDEISQSNIDDVNKANYYSQKDQDDYSDDNYNNNYNHQKQYPKQPSKLRRAFGFISKAIVFGLIAAVTFIGANEAFYLINPDSNTGISIFADEEEEKFTIKQTKVIEDTIVDTDVTKVAKDAMPSIVTITGTFTETYSFFGQQIDEEKQGGGSGIIIEQNESELLIATNNHVVEGANPIVVTFIDGEDAKAIIKGTDKTADLAVIAVDISNLSEGTRDSIEIAEVLDDGNVEVGEKVVAIGNALGIGQSVTVGYVSAVDREVDVGNNVMTLLQTDAAINPGNSGGALINMEGQVIGINTIKFAANEVEGMGYAIPVERAMPIINELKSREIIAEAEKGYLGVGIRDVTEDIANMFNWPVGVYVASVSPGGPADEAGIFQGDIIVGLNEIEITSTTQLIEKVTSYRTGTEVTVKIMRQVGNSYEGQDIVVTLGHQPENK